MTTDKFAQVIAETSHSQPLILDSRSEEEYAVSHFAKAQRIDGRSDLSIAPVLKNIPKSTPIIVYCSIGYRSSRVAQKLMEAGFKNVSNLEGGIFQWANEGRAETQIRPGSLVQGEQITQTVHPYDAWWGMLLNRQSRVG
jgi:rhodanese-related sulfurtransferase